MKTIIKLIIAALILSTSAVAQKVTGLIKDQKNQPLDYASVALVNLKDSSSFLQATNQNGLYEFKAVKSGKYLIKVLMMGYEKSSSQNFDVASSDVNLPTIVLVSKAENLKEVSITSKKPEVEYQADRTIVNVEQMNTAGDNALEVIGRAPGVKLDKDDNIILKGKQNITVMIDGKMSYMSGLELTTYLKSLPAEALSKLELISNPPASFDAASTGGFINIKLKRNKIQGFNGNANIGGGYGKYEKTYGGAMLNYNINKVSTYARVNVGRYNSFNRLTLNRTIGNEQFNQENYWHPITKSSNYSTGLDYFISDKHTVGAMYKGFASPVQTAVNSNSPSFAANGTKLGSVLMTNPQDNDTWSNAFNLNYRFKIDTNGRELNFDADYVNYSNIKDEHFTNFYYNANNQLTTAPINLRNNGFGGSNIYALKLDYIHPFSKTSKLEAGFKSSWVRTESNVAFDSLKNVGWINDPRRTNLFNYNEQINAGYVSFSQSFKKLDVKFGARLEQTLGNGSSSGDHTQINRNYWQMFPNASISYKADDKNQFTASYRKSINRPTYSNLNPFAFYTDPYTALKGNQFLQASYANSFEFNYSFKSLRLLTVSYATTRGAVSAVIYQNNMTKESIGVPENISNQRNLYFATGSPVDFFKWWNNSTELAVAYDEVNTPVLGNSFKASQWNWGVSTDNTFTLPRSYSLSLYAYYQSASVDGLIKMMPAYAMNIGAKKTFMKNNATLALKLNDVFATGRYRSLLQYGNVNTYWQNEWENRKVSLTFTYKFGNTKIKTARNRRTSTGEEENRL